MAEEHQNKSHEYEAKLGDEGQAVETQDRGMFDFLGKKKEEKPQEEVIVTEFEKVQVSEPEHKEFEKVQVSEPEHKDEEKKPGLLEKLHRSNSSSSSSSDEEDDEEKKKKKKEKKGLKEKILGEKEHEDTTVPVEKYEEAVHTETEGGHPEDKKGFVDKIKEKLPGHHKKTEEVPPPPPPPAEHSTTATEAASPEGEVKEKKGFLDKIKEKLPGYHPKTEEDKEKEKESATH
ncbi:hypothetical protein FNV43_RR12048 [Rhamnella rubrinervis]|uniref:Dehydrin n=1 Tax=Rhamnella rubrinervis TaxID=2594499 RepID=A0A8K0H777_9ROSA|nr:hypothetical protein FNV43_RR12048 [Rhamnella rubrinervis]